MWNVAFQVLEAWVALAHALMVKSSKLATIVTIVDRLLALVESAACVAGTTLAAQMSESHVQQPTTLYSTAHQMLVLGVALAHVLTVKSTKSATTMMAAHRLLALVESVANAAVIIPAVQV